MYGPFNVADIGVIRPNFSLFETLPGLPGMQCRCIVGNSPVICRSACHPVTFPSCDLAGMPLTSSGLKKLCLFSKLAVHGHPCIPIWLPILMLRTSAWHRTWAHLCGRVPVPNRLQLQWDSVVVEETGGQCNRSLGGAVCSPSKNSCIQRQRLLSAGQTRVQIPNNKMMHQTRRLCCWPCVSLSHHLRFCWCTGVTRASDQALVPPNPRRKKGLVTWPSPPRNSPPRELTCRRLILAGISAAHICQTTHSLWLPDSNTRPASVTMLAANTTPSSRSWHAEHTSLPPLPKF